jgi:inorganic triphosphatase YgiF
VTTQVSQEIEIKLAATPDMLEALREHRALAGPDRTSTLVTTYFDTADRRLTQAGASLRLRDTGTAQEQTIKLPARNDSIVVRGEWTAPALGPIPDLAGIAPEPRAALDLLLREALLLPIAETRIERTTRRIMHEPAQIEVAFDQGTIRAGPLEAAVCELELELVEGTLADLLDLARALPLGPDLQWSVASKSGRALALADCRPAAAAQAASPSVSRDMDAGQGFQTIAWSCLLHLLKNVSLVVASGDAEALHQCRVAIRRLRAGLGLFGPLFAGNAQAQMLAAELKAASNALGPARDANVLLERLTAITAREGQNASELLAHVRSVTEQTMKSAQVFLASPEFQSLLFTVARWIERAEWQDAERGASHPLPHFAARALRRRRRKIRRMGDNPAAMTVDERHKLRIAIKKLRYATDFVAPLYLSERAAKDLCRFKVLAGKVQARLGELHDLDVLAASREPLFRGLEPISAARLAAQLDALTPSLAASHDKLMKRAGRSIEKLDGCASWWKADL